jgi:hypothetical protein
MRKWLAFAAAASALALAAPAAAQWQSINQRQASLEARINAGVQNGSLTHDEAGRLRSQFNDLEELEARYRRTGNGLTDYERADLDQRFNTLSNRIQSQRHDDDWVSINARQSGLDNRIDAGVRDGSLTHEEAVRLRSQFNDLVRLEARYRDSGDGLSASERIDLDNRFDALSGRIAAQRDDSQVRGPDYHPTTYGRTLMRDRQAYFDQDLARARSDYGVPYDTIMRLRDQFRDLVQDERRYLNDNGRLDGDERAALDRTYYDLQWRLEQLRRQHGHN